MANNCFAQITITTATNNTQEFNNAVKFVEENYLPLMSHSAEIDTDNLTINVFGDCKWSISNVFTNDSNVNRLLEENTSIVIGVVGEEYMEGFSERAIYSANEDYYDSGVAQMWVIENILDELQEEDDGQPSWNIIHSHLNTELENCGWCPLTDKEKEEMDEDTEIIRTKLSLEPFAKDDLIGFYKESNGLI